MPPLRTNTPQSLEIMCMTEVFNHLQREVQLCNQLRRFEKKSLLLRRRGIDSDELQSEIGRYLDRLPPLLSENVRQHFTDLILSKPHDPVFTKVCHGVDKANALVSPRQHTFIIQLLEIILSDHVRSIKFSDKEKLVGFTLDSPIWSMISRLNGLHRFILTGNMFGGELNVRTFILSFLIDLTSNCKDLTELVLKETITTSAQLQTIGQNCHHLRKLDLTGARIKCTDILRLCVDVLPDDKENNSQPSQETSETAMIGRPTPLCQTLEVLILSNTNVSSRGAGLLLQRLPKLVSLGDLATTVDGIKKIYSLIKAKKCKPLKLKHVCYRGPSDIKLYILVHACPLLESLFLGSFAERRIKLRHMRSLSFKNLQRLTLENLHNDDITLALQHSPNLLRLKVDCVSLDISAVAKFCPLLTELVVHKEPVKDLNFLASIPGHQYFRELQTLRVLAPIALNIGAILFQNSEKLKTVEMVRIRDVDDQVFGSWLQSNPLAQIESLMIRYIGLTRITVDRLIATCPKLTTLGEMGGWDIRSWECRRIKELVTEQNLQLELVLYTAAAGDIYDIFHDNMSSEYEDTDHSDDDFLHYYDDDY